MINIPAIVGKINPVPLSSYYEIIEEYVDKVSRLEQVSSIIQMGSFTKPGISDIDLIVTLKDGMRFPGWDDISLINISKGHRDAEIVAHDIFILPEIITEKAEAYFYIDQQNVLKGKKLGGCLPAEVVEICKKFLALEYAIFSLDSIASILLSTSVEFRRYILLIGSMRHSVMLAFDLNILDENEKNKLVISIEKLRSDVLASAYSQDEISFLTEKFISLLNLTIKVIADEVTNDIHGILKRTWMVSPKTGMVGVKGESDYLKSFLQIIDRQENLWYSKYTRIFSVPIKAQMHIGAYLDGNEKAAIYFRNNFKMVKPFHDENELNAGVRKLRREVIKTHWQFIEKTGYFKSSGRAYCGLSYPNKKTYKSFIQKKLLSHQLKKFG